MSEGEPPSGAEAPRAALPSLRFHLVSVLPEIFDSFVSTGIVAKAVEKGLVSIDRLALRDFAHNKHKTVDDTPYGGGSGMVMMPGPIVEAMEAAEATELARSGVRPVRILLTPQGEPFTQARARDLSGRGALTLVSGRYEGIDERACTRVDLEISLGDFVLMGGEVGAMAIVEATARLVPGVLGNASSVEEESHAAGLLEYPQYTRPAEFRGEGIPEALLSGHHAQIAKWRREQAIVRTARKRPDLLASAPLSDAERALAEKVRGT
ncbi:MAG: tRNA (guanosine(37)-N1)-methyltransferase TrmD [Sandaracinus sp.]